MRQEWMNEYRYWLGYSASIFAIIMLITAGAVWILN
jgi:hypothetical protein